MKKFICVLIFLTSAVSFSQEHKHSVTFDYGGLSSFQVKSLFTDVLKAIVTIGEVTADNEKFSSVFTAGYEFALQKNLQLSAFFSYEDVTRDVLISKVKQGTQKQQFFSFVAGTKIHWLSGDIASIYTGIYGGLSLTIDEMTLEPGIETEGDTNGKYLDFAYHVTILGLRVGRAFGIHAEAGFGTRGIINIGISYRF